MALTTTAGRQKSTNVRPARTLRLLAMRGAFGTLDRLAPGIAGHWAARLWLTLPRTNAMFRDDRPIPGLFVAPSTRTTVDLPGGRAIATERWGEGSRTVYLVHGWGGWRGQLGGFVEPLLARGYSVVAFDMPSHGESGPGVLGPRRSHGVEMMDALHAAVEHHGKPTAIVAHSLGAAITAFAVGDGLIAPERLGFVAPTLGPVGHISATVRMLGAGARTEASMINRINSIVGRPITDFDTTKRPGPATLIVHDYKDKEVPYDEATQLAAAWPEARLLTTDGLGHQRILRATAVIDEIANFAAG
jgi:pimeloyl-ACP methyl ester carboxylesterase